MVGRLKVLRFIFGKFYLLFVHVFNGIPLDIRCACVLRKLLLNVHKEIFILLWQGDRLIAPRTLTVYKAHGDKFTLDRPTMQRCTRVAARSQDPKVVQFSTQKEFSLTIDCAFDWPAVQFPVNYLFNCSSQWCLT